MKKAASLIRPDYDQPNYDPRKIAPYTLEDPLTFTNGEKVKTLEDWKCRRREILKIFELEMFGEEPPAPETFIIENFEEKEGALAGFAVRTQYKMYFKSDKSGPCINWLLLRPRHIKEPVPVIMFLNYRGNQELIPDPEIPLMANWVRNDEFSRDHHAVEATRGIMCDPNSDTVLPIGMILARGYAVLTACYAEVSPDPTREESDEGYEQETFAYTGVFELWGKRDESRTDNITALGAWAWALSRGVDLVETLPDLNVNKIVVTGCSRLGKTALLAAARDERFAVCVPNQCGGGGVTLAKRDFGENIATEMYSFTHWYCKAYKKYEKNPAELLNFDQHLLVATIAPRPLLVVGFGSPWFDTEGEYLACKAAGCVWEFLGMPGFPEVDYPAEYDLAAVGRYLGYAHRSEEHGISAWDWTLLLDFASFHLKAATI